MAAPDTSFQQPLPRQEAHPGLEAREHPASPPAVDSVPSYLQAVQRLAIEANLIDVVDERARHR
jgi:hypothetical protein